MDAFDICDGSENIAVKFNDARLKDYLKNFQYVCCNIPAPGLDTKNFEDQIKGCSCAGVSCSIARDNNCSCVIQFGVAYDDDGRLVFQDGTQPRNHNALIECNSLCSCLKTCKNRVVQNGLQYKLEVFKDDAKGLCLRTLQPIQKGRFVCEYAGEVLTQEEAQRRAAAQTSDDMNYIFVLREHCATGVLTTYIDPCRVGNIGRFLNHSCGPNLFMAPVRVHNLVPKLCLFAVRDIAAGEELTYDYSGGGSSYNADLDQPETRSGKICKCKAENCRGFLPFDASVL